MWAIYLHCASFFFRRPFCPCFLLDMLCGVRDPLELPSQTPPDANDDCLGFFLFCSKTGCTCSPTFGGVFWIRYVCMNIIRCVCWNPPRGAYLIGHISVDMFTRWLGTSNGSRTPQRISNKKHGQKGRLKQNDAQCKYIAPMKTDDSAC